MLVWIFFLDFLKTVSKKSDISKKKTNLYKKQQILKVSQFFLGNCFFQKVFTPWRTVFLFLSHSLSILLLFLLNNHDLYVSMLSMQEKYKLFSTKIIFWFLFIFTLLFLLVYTKHFHAHTNNSTVGLNNEKEIKSTSFLSLLFFWFLVQQLHWKTSKINCAVLFHGKFCNYFYFLSIKIFYFLFMMFY